jgi:hypothetical protein
MTSPKVRKALSDLYDFRPVEWGPDAERDPEESLKKGEEVNDLIRLAARFAESLDGRPLKKLSARAGWLDRRIRPGTPFSEAWQAVRPLLGKRRGKAGRNWPKQASAILTCPSTNHIFFPLLMEAAQGDANTWLYEHPKGPEHKAFERWRDELYKVSVGAERRHFWGSYLLELCHLAKHPKRPVFWLYDCLRTAFKDRARVARAMQEAAKDLFPAAGRPPSPRFHHSFDFRSVHWFGQDYCFTPYQAACVQRLWEAWEQRNPEVSQAAVLADAEIVDSKRLVDLFKGNSAWGTMIVRGKLKGAYRLQEPTPPSA